MDWLRLVALACCTLTACPTDEAGGDEGNDPPPLPGPGVGDPCNTAVLPCLSSWDALRCVDGQWEQVACADVCIAKSAAYVDGLCVADKCACELGDPGGCDPLNLICISPDVIELCSETQEPREVACTELCAEGGYTNTAGCSQPIFSPAVCLCE